MNSTPPGRETIGNVNDPLKIFRPFWFDHRLQMCIRDRHHPAYLAAVSQLMEDVLADANAPIFDIIKPEALRDLLDHDMKYPWYGQLMMKAQVISFFLQLHYVLVSSRH